MSATVKHYYSYNQIHLLIRSSLPQFTTCPDILVAISGGGLIPARILRTLLKSKFNRTVPIRVIGLQLYDDDAEKMCEGGVKRTQWPRSEEWGVTGKAATDGNGEKSLNVWVVDEVDDTRTTLQYALSNLQNDLGNEATFGIFVVHDKRKPKRGVLPGDVEYISAVEVDDHWIVYPWDATDIDEHQRLCDSQACAKETSST
ncbi:hypothetical protein BC832DRAFT_566714 [Gaertneriomyces semiglobifer]|nr:hypothetical protein BC832DRAFT_566714 [Gaertneriomyces semiglobifer]